MRLMKIGLLAAMVFAWSSAAIASDDSVTAKNASLTSVTFCSKDIGSGVMASCQVPVDPATGAKISPMPKKGGQVGGLSFFVANTPTIQAAAYAAGNCMGGFQAITVTGTAGATGTLHSFQIQSKAGLATAKQIYVFTSNPSSSTCTDKGTFTIASADRAKLLSTFSVTPAIPSGDTGSYGEATGMGRAFATSGNGNLYIAVVETAAETPASTSDLIVSIGGYIDQP